jgi:hypothetical protein
MAASVENVLDLLDGWVITDPPTEPEPEEPPEDPEEPEPEPEPPTDDGEVHSILTTEVEKFITKATVRAAAYIGLTDSSKLPDNSLTAEAVATWAAGLLWNKYIVKVNEGKEQDDPNTYGDKKIWEAKAMLKPYLDDKNDDGVSDVHIYTSTYVSD